MKTPKNVVSSAHSDADLLTPGDLRGIAAATKRAEKLKEKYAAKKEEDDKSFPDHFSIMAGPVKKIR